ncbi:MAG: uncharacterized protein A8A55_2648 [Amphiamblys sp. WSBS2006]|nr:MAG: uncharacterized protein A8A55_2648 [Amphiamblys sp. WSBS2006]
MQKISALVAALSVSACALINNFAYVPRDVLPQFPTEQDGDIYFLNERDELNILCSVYFTPDARDKRAPLLRFVYDETEAKAHYPSAEDITEEVAGFITDRAEVDTELKLFFVSFADDMSPVQAVPEGIAEVSVLRAKENSIDYLYKKEKKHGNIFDRFLIAEECKYEDKGKAPRIKNIPEKKRSGSSLVFSRSKGNPA